MKDCIDVLTVFWQFLWCFGNLMNLRELLDHMKLMI